MDEKYHKLVNSTYIQGDIADILPDDMIYALCRKWFPDVSSGIWEYGRPFIEHGYNAGYAANFLVNELKWASEIDVREELNISDQSKWNLLYTLECLSLTQVSNILTWADSGHGVVPQLRCSQWRTGGPDNFYDGRILSPSDPTNPHDIKCEYMPLFPMNLSSKDKIPDLKDIITKNAIEIAGMSERINLFGELPPADLNERTNAPWGGNTTFLGAFESSETTLDDSPVVESIEYSNTVFLKAANRYLKQRDRIIEWYTAIMEDLSQYIDEQPVIDRTRYNDDLSGPENCRRGATFYDFAETGLWKHTNYIIQNYRLQQVNEESTDEDNRLNHELWDQINHYKDAVRHDAAVRVLKDLEMQVEDMEAEFEALELIVNGVHKQQEYQSLKEQAGLRLNGRVPFQRFFTPAVMLSLGDSDFIITFNKSKVREIISKSLDELEAAIVKAEPSIFSKREQEDHMRSVCLALHALVCLAVDKFEGRPLLADWTPDIYSAIQEDTIDDAAMTPNEKTIMKQRFADIKFSRLREGIKITAGGKDRYDEDKLTTFGEWEEVGAMIPSQGFRPFTDRRDSMTMRELILHGSKGTPLQNYAVRNNGRYIFGPRYTKWFLRNTLDHMPEEGADIFDDTADRHHAIARFVIAFCDAYAKANAPALQFDKADKVNNIEDIKKELAKQEALWQLDLSSLTVHLSDPDEKPLHQPEAEDRKRCKAERNLQMNMLIDIADDVRFDNIPLTAKLGLMDKFLFAGFNNNNWLQRAQQLYGNIFLDGSPFMPLQRMPRLPHDTVSGTPVYKDINSTFLPQLRARAEFNIIADFNILRAKPYELGRRDTKCATCRMLWPEQYYLNYHPEFYRNYQYTDFITAMKLRNIDQYAQDVVTEALNDTEDSLIKITPMKREKYYWEIISDPCERIQFDLMYYDCKYKRYERTGPSTQISPYWWEMDPLSTRKINLIIPTAIEYEDSQCFTGAFSRYAALMQDNLIRLAYAGSKGYSAIKSWEDNTWTCTSDKKFMAEMVDAYCIPMRQDMNMKMFYEYERAVNYSVLNPQYMFMSLTPHIKRHNNQYLIEKNNENMKFDLLIPYDIFGRKAASYKQPQIAKTGVLLSREIDSVIAAEYKDRLDYLSARAARQNFVIARSGTGKCYDRESARMRGFIRDLCMTVDAVRRDMNPSAKAMFMSAGSANPLYKEPTPESRAYAESIKKIPETAFRMAYYGDSSYNMLQYAKAINLMADEAVSSKSIAPTRRLSVRAAYQYELLAQMDMLRARGAAGKKESLPDNFFMTCSRDGSARTGMSKDISGIPDRFSRRIDLDYKILNPERRFGKDAKDMDSWGASGNDTFADTGLLTAALRGRGGEGLLTDKNKERAVKLLGAPAKMPLYSFGMEMYRHNISSGELAIWWNDERNEDDYVNMQMSSYMNTNMTSGFQGKVTLDKNGCIDRGADLSFLPIFGGRYSSNDMKWIETGCPDVFYFMAAYPVDFIGMIDISYDYCEKIVGKGHGKDEYIMCHENVYGLVPLQEKKLLYDGSYYNMRKVTARGAPLFSSGPPQNNYLCRGALFTGDGTPERIISFNPADLRKFADMLEQRYIQNKEAARLDIANRLDKGTYGGKLIPSLDRSNRFYYDLVKEDYIAKAAAIDYFPGISDRLVMEQCVSLATEELHIDRRMKPKTQEGADKEGYQDVEFN